MLELLVPLLLESTPSSDLLDLLDLLDLALVGRDEACETRLPGVDLPLSATREGAALECGNSW